MSIEVRGLSFTYNKGLPSETMALCDVSFCVNPGEILSIVGETGSGKSTLAQHLNALLIPECGHVFVDGVEIVQKSPSLRNIRRMVGLVFQYPEQQIFAETVLDELSFGPLNWGCSKEEAIEKARNAMKLMCIDESMLDKNPFLLSGGQKRRLAIASVLASEPKYLVLDEPTAGLDASGAEQLVSMLTDFTKMDRGVVHITHDLDTALSISSRILILDKGRVVFCGTPYDTAHMLCGLGKDTVALPDVLSLSKSLREHKKLKKIAWQPSELAQMIGEAQKCQ